MPQKHHIRRIDIENIDLLIDYFHYDRVLDPKSEFFDIILLPDIGNLTSQIKQGLLKIYCLLIDGEVLAFYFFKDEKTMYDEVEGNTSHLIASVMNGYSLNVFHLGFLHVLRQEMRLHKSLKILSIDEIGHNVNLMNVWRYKNTPQFTSDTAYYLFNFIYPGSPLLRERCLILT